jgi:hypothetical protein
MLLLARVELRKVRGLCTEEHIDAREERSDESTPGKRRRPAQKEQGPR